MRWEGLTTSPEQTLKIAKDTGQLAEAGQIIALVGPLGAGKTLFVRGLAEGLQVPDPSVVSSPTFVLMQLYEGGRLPLYHFDAYRLNDPGQLAAIGAEEIFEGGQGVVAIEWAEKVQQLLPADRLWVRLGYDGEGQRKVVMEAAGERSSRLLAKLVSRL